MGCFQITACRPISNVSVTPLPQTFLPSLPPRSVGYSFSLSRPSLRLSSNTRTYQQRAPVCLFGGGKGMSKNDNDASPWKFLENAMSSFKKDKSVENLLRQQIEKQEYYDDGGSGGIPPRGDGGGGGSGESEDESFSGVMEEFLQVLFATMGFIFLYAYIISGQEMIRLVKDYVKYVSGGTPSTRLKGVMNMWVRLGRKLTEKKLPEEKDWLAIAIINTETQYDSPEKYRRVLQAYMQPTASSEDDEEQA